MRLSPETCRVKPLRRIKTQLLHLVGLISLLYPIALLGIEPATFRLVAQCLNQLCYHVPLCQDTGCTITNLLNFLSHPYCACQCILTEDLNIAQICYLFVPKNGYIYIYIYYIHKHTHTGCNRRNGPDFGRVFLRSNYTEITQNTYIQS